MSHKSDHFPDEEDSIYYCLDFEVHSKEDIENMITYIKSLRDDEAAHICEDKLHEEFISAIANNRITNASELAELVLTTNDLHFARWCA